VAQHTIKMKNLLLILFGLSLSFLSEAQSDTLKVFYINGKASQTNPVTKKEQPLKLNMPLYDSCTVKLFKKASVILIDNKGYSVSLLEGEHNISKIITNIKSQNSYSNIFTEYFSYIVKHLFEEHKDLDKYARKYMRKRGLAIRDGCASPLMQTPYFGASIKTDSLTFTWNKDSTTQIYTLQIYEVPNGGKVLDSVDVVGTKFSRNINKLKKGVDYYWSVFPKNNVNCARFKFKIEKSESLLKFEEKMKELETLMTYGKAMNALVKAEMYEQNNFISEALEQYEIALKEEPNNSIFQEAFTLFTARNTLKL
jgi:hypothetical protein